jgi:hypothetical protein
MLSTLGFESTRTTSSVSTRCFLAPVPIGNFDLSSLDRISLQTGMRGAYGKPTGKVARVEIGQPIMSIRAKDAHKDHVVECLRRSKFKVFFLVGHLTISSLVVSW